jgi:HK97 family phage major capsid protein
MKVPTTPEGLQELLSDPTKLKEFFSPDAIRNGDNKAFLDAYARQYVRHNPDAMDDMRTQVQSTLFDLIRDNGGGRRPAVDIRNALSFPGGRPQLTLGANGTAAIARGRGAVYNRWAPGARMEKDLPDSDRFDNVGDLCNAIRMSGTVTSDPRAAEYRRKLDVLREFQNSFGSEDPGAGGFLIPEQLRADLLQLSLESSVVRPHATVIPMSTLKVPIPTVDDTSHASNVFGGIQFYWAEESSSITESQAKFGRVTLEARKLAGFFKVPNELLSDAPAFSAFFDTAVPKGLAWFEDLAFLAGTGSTQPLGVIGTQNPAYVTIDRAATNQIAYADVVSIYSRMLPQSLGSAVWVANIDTFPQLAQMQGPSGNPGVWMGGWGNAPTAADAPPMNLMGRPIYFTEKVPSIGGSGTAGDLSFIDFSYYLIGDRQAVAVAASEHAAFQNDQTAYRLIERVDGRPWMQSALTPHNGSNTLSPYVGTSATHT